LLSRSPQVTPQSNTESIPPRLPMVMLGRAARRGSGVSFCGGF
jgi:hypothetical protein